jgi:hypothetical protein
LNSRPKAPHAVDSRPWNWNNAILARNCQPIPSQIPLGRMHCYHLWERKYYELQHIEANTFVKRSLSPGEWACNIADELFVLRMGMELLINEAAAIHFVRRNTCIPVPTVRCAFEDHGWFYLITDMVPGVVRVNFSPHQKAVVTEELSGYLECGQWRPRRWVVSWVMHVYHTALPWPFRMMQEAFLNLTIPLSTYVLCYNDLSQYNIIVDEETLKINAETSLTDFIRKIRKKTYLPLLSYCLNALDQH